MANLLAGTASVSVDGTSYQLEGSFKYSPSTVKREALMGMDGFHGWKETPVTGFISMTLRDAGSLTVADFNAMKDATVVGQLANGKTVIGRSMGTVDAQEVDSTDAKFDVRFEGIVTEQTSS